MAIVPNLARPWQNPDLHWHGNADEVHGAVPVSGEGDSGSGGGEMPTDLSDFTVTADDPLGGEGGNKTQSLTAWVNSLVPKFFWEEVTNLEHNDAQFAWGSHFVSHVGFITHQTEAHAPQIQATLSVARHAAGSGTFGANSGDYSLFVVGRKDSYLTSTVQGEIGAIWSTAWQGKHGDVSAFLGDASKNITADGTGGIAGAEIAGRQVDASGNTVKLIKGLVGHILLDGFGMFGGGAVGFYAEPQTGPAKALYFGTSLDATTPYEYALMFNKDRDITKTYFTVDDDGNIAQGLSTGRRTFGMNGTTWEMKNTAGTVIGSWGDNGDFSIASRALFQVNSAILGGWTINSAAGISALTDSNAHSCFISSTAGDATSYYSNNLHWFRNRAGGTAIAIIADTQCLFYSPIKVINSLTVYDSVTPTSSIIYLNSGGSVGIYNDGGKVNVLGIPVNVVSLRVADVKVVGAQGAAIANATDAGTAISQLNLALAAMRTHGLIAT